MITPATATEQMSANALILALEASGDAVSVAVLQNDVCRAFKQHQARFGHAEHLVGLVREALADAGADISAITHIAAGCGPGSFTGLRVCLSAAKGYALATTAQPVGVNGLAALAVNTYSAASPDPDMSPALLGPIICFADTRRQSVFVQIFDAEARAQTSVADIPFDQLSSWLSDVVERSEGLTVRLSGITDQLAVHISDHAGFIASPQPVDAAMIARYAALSLAAPDDYPHTGFSPLYVVAPKLGPAKHQT